VFIERPDVMAMLQGYLDAVRSSGHGQILAIRGRRQAGKSAAIEHFCDQSEVPYVFATGIQRAPIQVQMEDFASAVLQSHQPLPNAGLMFGSVPTSWRDCFGLLEVIAQQGPIIVVLDEFPWMAEGDVTLEGSLQASWDRHLERLPILLILVGSDVTMMQRLSTYNRPLFGRLREIIFSPLNPADIAGAADQWTSSDVIDAYLVTGGFPRLVTDLIKAGTLPAPFVRQSLLDPLSSLVATGCLVLNAELPDSPVTAAILAAIGANDLGWARFSDITPPASSPNEINAAKTATTTALKVLSGPKRLIEMEMPAWAADASRLRRYRVADPYLRFWFRYVRQYANVIERGRADLAIDHFDRDWTSWRGYSVEPLVRESLLRLGAVRKELSSIEKVSPWWTRDGQTEIDVVAMSRVETVLVGTIKWRQNQGVTGHDMKALADDARLVPKSTDYQLAAICRQGDRPQGADLFFTADDIVRAWG